MLRQLSERIHARLIYPLIVGLRGEGAVFRMLKELHAAEQLTARELRSRQDERLASLLRYARTNSQYYSDRVPDRPFTPEDIRSTLEQMPILRKHDLRRDVDSLLARPQPPHVTRKITGGSTGEAVTVFKDGVALAHERAASWLGYGWFGINVGDRGARFWGTPQSLRRRARYDAADFAMHRIRFSAFAFDEADLERYWRKCLSFRPRFFYGYASMLEEFARFVMNEDYDGGSLGLKAVVSTSEVLSDPQRTLISTAFRTKVQNEYGCGEVGPIAYECPEGRLHVMSENLVVELLTPQGEAAAVGDTGEVVVTDLNNRAMPLMRYALGDFAVWADGCDCGRPFPTLERVWGRAYDFVEAPSGRRFHGEFFMYYFEELRAAGVDVSKFKVVQDTVEHIDLLLVLPSSSGNEIEQRIARGLQQRLSGMAVSARRVPAIDPLPSGKTQIILNLLLQRDVL